MNSKDINCVDGFNQKQVYEEFKKFCKLSVEEINDYGVHFLHVTNGNPDPYYAIDIEFIPKESKLETVDRILVHGFSGGGYSLENLLKIGYEKLGVEAFNSKEEVDALNASIESMSNIKTSSHIR
jgi:hypothetical protein